MKIWRLKQHGNPLEQLELVDEDAPKPGPGEVLIDQEAVGLAFPDVLSCRGMYQVKSYPGHTPGGESCGTVAALGEGVAGVEVGQRVVYLGSGGLAEQVVHPAAGVFVVPGGVSAETAAAIPINYCTTLYALEDRAKLQSGESVLITGAAGGTGTAAIQLSKAMGATTIAIAGGETKVGVLRDVGADVVIDHQENPDWVDLVRKASGGGVDVAYDPVGGDTFHQVRRCMGWDGRLSGDRLRRRDPRVQDQPCAAEELLGRRGALGCCSLHAVPRFALGEQMRHAARDGRGRDDRPAAVPAVRVRPGGPSVCKTSPTGRRTARSSPGSDRTMLIRPPAAEAVSGGRVRRCARGTCRSSRR